MVNRKKSISKNYPKPPVMEAVIEVRFNEKLSDSQLESLFPKQKSKFTIQKIEEVRFPFSSEVTQPPQTRLHSLKLIENQDTANIIQIRHDAISGSRLPPYDSWDKLFENFKKYYDVYTKKKPRSISRLSARYINRIDIPNNGKKIKIEDYIKIFPNVPNKGFPALSDYLAQTTFQIDENHVMTINSYRCPETILIDNLSVILDLDIARIKNLPSSEKHLLEAFKEIRKIKNIYFEKLITPKCRELFKS